MAKRSKKKNPESLSNRQRENLRHNQALDLEKGKWDNKLNITLAVVIVIVVIAFLFTPLLSMNFSGSLSEFMGDLVTEDQTMSVGVNMTAVDFLFAMTKGCSDSIEYIAQANSDGSEITAQIIYNAFMMKMTQEEVSMFDMAYVFCFIVCILMLLAIILLIVSVSISRRKNEDGKLLLASVIIFSSLASILWLFFVIMGIASYGRAQIQPHIGCYFLFFGGVTLCAVYGLYRKKLKALDGQRRPVEDTQNDTKAQNSKEGK